MEFIKYFEECVGGRIATCADKRETITVKQKTFFHCCTVFFLTWTVHGIGQNWY